MNGCVVGLVSFLLGVHRREGPLKPFPELQRRFDSRLSRTGLRGADYVDHALWTRLVSPLRCYGPIEPNSSSLPCEVVWRPGNVLGALAHHVDWAVARALPTFLNSVDPLPVFVPWARVSDSAV